MTGAREVNLYFFSMLFYIIPSDSYSHELQMQEVAQYSVW